MDIKNLIDQALELAKVAGAVIPGMQSVAAGVSIGEKVIAIIDDLTDDAPDTRTQDQLRAARKELRAKVSAKAQALADRLDG